MSAPSIKDHPVQGVISRFIELQNSPEFSEPMVVENEQYVFARDKVFAMAHVLRGLLHSTPAELTSAPGLSNLTSNLQSPLGELSAFIADKNPQRIVIAASQFEQNVLPIVWSLGPQLQNLAPDSVADLLESQAAASREAIRQLTVQRDALAANLQLLSTKASEQIASFNSLMESAARERAEAGAAVAKLEQQFAEKETERASKVEAAIATLTQNFNEFDHDRRGDAAKLILQLEGHVEEARKLVQIVGNDTVTGNYQNIAKAEGKTADLWRIATLLFFGLGLFVAALTFYKFWGETLNADNAWAVVIRLLYAIAITTPAWYTARESARHRTNSDRARQTELELASIGPFIELLPEEKKIEIREKMTSLYFGKGVEAHTVTDPTETIKSLGTLAVDLIKAAKK